MAILTINNAACNVVIYPAKYGLLYNWPAATATGTTSITSSDDWRLSTEADFMTLSTYLGGNSVSCGKMKEPNEKYWNNIIGDGSANFNGRGAGKRTFFDGTFEDLGIYCWLWVSDDPDGSSAVRIYYLYNLAYSLSYVNGPESVKKQGNTVRLVYTGSGTPTSYTGNDGKVYRVVTIGTQTWLADNLSETRFRNGDIIPWYGANPVDYFTNAEWAALTTAGVCAYNNTLSNVAPGFTFPT